MLRFPSAEVACSSLYGINNNITVGMTWDFFPGKVMLSSKQVACVSVSSRGA